MTALTWNPAKRPLRSLRRQYHCIRDIFSPSARAVSVRPPNGSSGTAPQQPHAPSSSSPPQISSSGGFQSVIKEKRNYIKMPRHGHSDHILRWQQQTAKQMGCMTEQNPTGECYGYNLNILNWGISYEATDILEVGNKIARTKAVSIGMFPEVRTGC